MWTELTVKANVNVLLNRDEKWSEKKASVMGSREQNVLVDQIYWLFNRLR